MSLITLIDRKLLIAYISNNIIRSNFPDYGFRLTIGFTIFQLSVDKKKRYRILRLVNNHFFFNTIIPLLHNMFNLYGVSPFLRFSLFMVSPKNW